MASRFLLGVALLFGLSMTASAQAPFCVVSNLGKDCNYYDTATCRDQARLASGACVVNQDVQPSLPSAQPAQPSQGPQGIDFGATSRGQRQAQEANRAEQQERRAAEEHVARMRMLQAQQGAAQSATAQPSMYVPPSASVAPGSGFITQAPPNSTFGQARLLYSSCQAFLQSMQQGAPAATTYFGGYCFGTVRAFLVGHQMQKQGAGTTLFCIGGVDMADVVGKLMAVPPTDPNGDDLLYVRDRLIADWPC